MNLRERIRAHHGLKADDPVGVKAVLAERAPEVNEAQRLVTAVANTAAIDLDNEVVIPEGADKTYFAKAKAIYWNHDYDRPPIGTLRNASLKGGRWVIQYRASDKTEFARDIYGLVLDGAVNGVSIGFVPRDSGRPTDAEVELYGLASSVVRSWLWLETSAVSMPCNPEAWITGRSAGRPADSFCDAVSKRVGRGLCSKATAEALGVTRRRGRIVVV